MYIDPQKLESSSSSQPYAFDQDSLQDVNSSNFLNKRLQALVLLSVLYLFLFTLVQVLFKKELQTDFLWSTHNIFIFCFSLLTFVFLRWTNPSQIQLTSVAVCYQMLLAFSLASNEFLQISEGLKVGVGISKASIVAIIFPLFTSGSIQQKMVLAGLSALMIPLAYWFQLRMGLPSLSEEVIYPYFVTNILVCSTSLAPAALTEKLKIFLQKAKALGAYEFEKDGLIGVGGMGEVWKARHSMLMRPAAIKIFKRDVSYLKNPVERKNAARRFKREAQAIASLQSPHTIEIFDVGTCQNNFSYYYAMELLDGIDLKQLIEKFGPISSGRTIYFLKQACHSLRNAHENQLIHRDIKPANIFVCKYGSDFDFIKVLDFGLVKLLDSDNKEKSLTTQKDLSSGTPAFIAPEMALGHETAPTTDIYSLGCVAYWLLTGQLVFDGENALQVAVKHAKEEAERPSQRSELPINEELEQLIMQCLEKDPQNRPQSVDQLMSHLERIEASLLQDEKWNSAKARRWWELHHPKQDKPDASEELIESADKPTEK